MYLTEILARCSDLERRMAKLYRLLAARFPDSADSTRLWREFALEDETYADILRRELRNLEEADDSGAFLPEYAAPLADADRVVADFERRARELKSLDEALVLSLGLEQVTLEDLYDDLVVKGPPAFKPICERLEASLSARPAADVPGVPRRRRDRTSALKA